MTRLAWTFLRAGGRGRAALLAGCSAAAVGLLLVAISLLLLPSRPDERLFNLVAEPGLRGGTTFGTALLVLPLLLLLYQVVRLGTASRERRLAALRLAGATPGDVRAIGAVEVGLPVTVGALTGPLVYVLLRAIFGGQQLNPGENAGGGLAYSNSVLALVPTTVSPAWWQVVAMVLGVSVAGVVTGALASRHLVSSPLGVSRRQRRPAPRPWGMALVGAGLLVFGATVFGLIGENEAVVMAAVLLVVLGMVSLAPWVAYRSGLRAAGRTSLPATLIAAGHLTSDPRPAGRAAAAVGAVGLVSGVLAAVEADVLLRDSPGGVDRFFVTSFLLVGAALLVVLLVTASTLAVHAVESLVDRRRVLAALVAAGTPVAVLKDALRREATLTSIPLSLGGALLGAALASAADPFVSPAVLLLLAAQVAATVALTWAAIRVAVRVAVPTLLRVVAPTNLRTE